MTPGHPPKFPMIPFDGGYKGIVVSSWKCTCYLHGGIYGSTLPRLSADGACIYTLVYAKWNSQPHKQRELVEWEHKLVNLPGIFSPLSVVC